LEVNLTLVVDNSSIFEEDLFNQMMELGKYTAKEAEVLVRQKLLIEKEVKSLRRKLKVPRLIPASYIEGMPEGDIAKFLYNKAGFDTIGYQWTYDICCYTWNEKQECGRVVIGNERLDKKWQQSGNMSDDAFHHLTRDIVRDGMKHDVK
jgi:hypothetical protein